MIVPIEFKRFARLYLQGHYAEAGHPVDPISMAVGRMDASDVPPAKAYVDSLLDSGMGEEQLDSLWKSCEPHYWIEEGKMKVFLTEVQKELGKASP